MHMRQEACGQGIGMRRVYLIKATEQYYRVHDVHNGLRNRSFLSGGLRTIKGCPHRPIGLECLLGIKPAFFLSSNILHVCS